MNSEIIIEKINKQRDALLTSPFKNYRNRIKALKLLKNNIKEMEGEIQEALKKDLNKCEIESYMAEIGIVLSEINYMIRHIRKFSKIQKVSSPVAQFPSKSYRIPCARGVVLIISPWNYPFMLALDPLIDAIAAGNSVVLKPSETSKHTQIVIEKLITKTFAPEQVMVVMGGRNECDFLLDQDFDYIFFTGSTRVGKIVMQKAAEHFTPVTLEMGGKSPCIVDKTANIELSARRIIFGKLLNCGQTCVAPDFIYCHEDIKNQLIEELKKQIILQYSVDPISNENYPKMINEKQFNSMVDLIDKNDVVFGGKTSKKLLKIEPTILDSTFDDDAMQNEIFGPILPIVTYKTHDEAIIRLNQMPKPLAFYVFSESKKVQEKFINSCNFGGGCINDVVIHLATSKLPFGGLKTSGMGAYHGKVGFETFTHYKSVLNKKTWLDLPMRYQPFSKLKYKIIRMFLK